MKARIKAAGFLALALITASVIAKSDGAGPGPLAGQDVLRCDRLSWLTNCKALNLSARENPSAPLRVVDPKGLEFHFPPGTPSVMMEHLLQPSKATAARVIDYQNAIMERSMLAARFSQEVMAERGHRDTYALHLASNPPTITDPGLPRLGGDRVKPKNVSTKNVRAWLFYDSKCAACVMQIAEMKRLREDYPNLELTLLQLDDDQSFVERLRGREGFKAGAIPAAQRESYSNRIKVTPTIWVENTKTKATWTLEGLTTVATIERAIVEASK